MIRTAPLSQLILSDLNPRQTPDASDVAIMRASIEAEGLLTPPLAYVTPDGAVAVVDGGTRLFALRQINDDTGDNPEIPYTLTSETDARRKAMAAQAVRSDLPPVAEMRAYQAAVKGGAEIMAIAASWGQTERYVKQRLALAALPDVIIDALDKGEIPLYCADAFASAGDRAQEMWDQFGAGARSNPRHTPSDIRRALSFIGAHDRRRRILETITVNAFIEAGGVVEQDLFSDDIRIENPQILETLYSEHIGVAAADFAKGEGYRNWLLGDSEDPKGSVPVFKPYLGLTPEDQAREDELAEQESLTSEEQAEIDELYTKANTRGWPDGYSDVVTMRLSESGGDISCNSGFVPKDRLEDAYDAGILPRPTTSSSAKDPGDHGEEADSADEGYSASVIADLRNLPIDIARDQITDKPELALTILAWALRCGVLHKPLSISYEHTTRSGLIDEDIAIKGWAAEDYAFQMSLEEAEKLGKASRNRVIAGLVATTLDLSALDQVKAHLAIDVRSAWTPDQTFLTRLKKPALAEIAQELGANDIKVDKMKKGELVEALAAIFANPPKTIAATVNSWLPPVLRPAPAIEVTDEKDKAA